MMNKEQKKNYIEEMTNKFENSKAVMVTHYHGLTMTQLDELRAKMREHGIIFKITKNRITKLALEKTKCKDLSNLFTGHFFNIIFLLFFIHHNYIVFPNLTLYETPIVEVAKTLLIKSPFKVLFDFSFSKASKIAL